MRSGLFIVAVFTIFTQTVYSEGNSKPSITDDSPLRLSEIFPNNDGISVLSEMFRNADDVDALSKIFPDIEGIEELGEIFTESVISRNSDPQPSISSKHPNFSTVDIDSVRERLSALFSNNFNTDINEENSDLRFKRRDHFAEADFFSSSRRTPQNIIDMINEENFSINDLDMSDTETVMSLIADTSDEFKDEFLNLLLRSDRDGLTRLMREMISFHMRQNRKSNFSRARKQPHTEVISSPVLTVADLVRISSNSDRAPVNRQGKINNSRSNISSAKLLHREVISIPARYEDGTIVPFRQRVGSFKNSNVEKAQRLSTEGARGNRNNFGDDLIGPAVSFEDAQTHISSNILQILELLNESKGTPVFNEMLERIAKMAGSDDNDRIIGQQLMNEMENLVHTLNDRQQSGGAKSITNPSTHSPSIDNTKIGISLPGLANENNKNINIHSNFNIENEQQNTQFKSQFSQIGGGISNFNDQKSESSVNSNPVRTEHGTIVIDQLNSNNIGVPLPSLSTNSQFPNAAGSISSDIGDQFEFTENTQLNNNRNEPIGTSDILAFEENPINNDNTKGENIFVPLSTDIDGQLPGIPLPNFQSPIKDNRIKNERVGVSLPSVVGLKNSEFIDNFPILENNPSFGEIGIPLPTNPINSVSGNNQNEQNGNIKSANNFVGHDNTFGISLPSLNSPSISDQPVLTNNFNSQTVGVGLPTISSRDQTSTNTQNTDNLRVIGSNRIPSPNIASFQNIYSQGNVGVPLPSLNSPSVSDQAGLTNNFNSQTVGIGLPTISSTDQTLSKTQNQENLRGTPSPNIASFQNINSQGNVGIPLPSLNSASISDQAVSTNNFRSQNVGVGLPTISSRDHTLSKTQNNDNLRVVSLKGTPSPSIASFQNVNFQGNVGVPLPSFNSASISDQAGLTNNFNSQTVGVGLPTLSSTDHTLSKTQNQNNLRVISSSGSPSPNIASFKNVNSQGNVGVSLPLPENGIFLRNNLSVDDFRIVNSNENIVLNAPVTKNRRHGGVLNRGEKFAVDSRNRLFVTTKDKLDNSAEDSREFSTTLGLNRENFSIKSKDNSHERILRTHFRRFSHEQNDGQVREVFAKVGRPLPNLNNENFSFKLKNSVESFDEDDAIVNFKQVINRPEMMYDVVDHTGEKNHKIVTFLTPGILVPVRSSEDDSREENSREFKFNIYNKDRVKSLNRAPSPSYTAPPMYAPSYHGSDNTCASSTNIIVTRVVSTPQTTHVTFLTDYVTNVETSTTYSVTPVTIVRTLTVAREITYPQKTYQKRQRHPLEVHKLLPTSRVELTNSAESPQMLQALYIKPAARYNPIPVFPPTQTYKLDDLFSNTLTNEIKYVGDIQSHDLYTLDAVTKYSFKEPTHYRAPSTSFLIEDSGLTQQQQSEVGQNLRVVPDESKESDEVTVHPFFSIRQNPAKRRRSSQKKGSDVQASGRHKREANPVNSIEVISRRLNTEKYAIGTKLISSTFLRTLTKTVPKTIVSSIERISSSLYGPSYSTITSTSILCLPTKRSDAILLEDSRDFSSEEYRTPPLPFILGKPAAKAKSNHPPFKPSSGFRTNPYMYRTWVGTQGTNEGGVSVLAGDSSNELPQKFILLQHLWPKSFILGSGGRDSNGKQHHIKLSPIEEEDSFEKIAVNGGLQLDIQ